ncbi:serine acetyltransferase [Mucilaginibacter sp. RS28]|uniref:Serine acetyltransferase n=1 Tax=Mucilaginibacter straminoryzae TaxID=2932774 RepID=A0A9X1X5X1_9SPHI|nr:serine acetyltransferase [Mucilaginibacter straminoryzae]MCJ8211010.1 serine acetyltransferase [Mucilaginibacter straminoryzae]
MYQGKRMGFFRFIFQDWQANKGNAKGRIILLLFRIANFCATRRIYYYIGFLYLMFYRIMVEWFFSIEIPWNVQIGPNFRLYHGQALVMTNQVVIGEGCTLRQSTTIGNKQLPGGGFTPSPIIGNYVDVGSNVCIIGNITIGDHAKIGAGAVVVKDVPAYHTAVGNPAVNRLPKSTITNTFTNEETTHII